MQSDQLLYICLNFFKNRVNNSFSIFVNILPLFLMPFTFASELNEKSITHSKHIPLTNVKENSFIENEIWINKILTPDDSGIMKSMASQVEEWNNRETYITNWNLDTIEGHTLPSQEEKNNYIRSNALKFLDRKVNQELKNSNKDTAIYKIGYAQKQLTPTQNFKISQNSTMKFKMELIQGKASIHILNPFFQGTINYFPNNNRLMIKVSKDLNSFDLKTAILYHSDNKALSTIFDQKITDSISGKISFIRPIGGNDVNSKSSNNKVELTYLSHF